MLSNLRSMLVPMSMCLLITAATESVRAEGRVPVFSDGFDTAGLLAESYKLSPASAWRIEDGRLVTSLGGVATAALKQDIPIECEISVDVTPLEVKGEFAGVMFNGINFLLRADGYWNPYRIEGVEKSLGNIVKADVKANQTYQFKIICRKVNEALMFSWFVNGQRVVEFIEPGKTEGKGFSFFVNKMPAAYDNLAVSGLVQGDVSSNLLPNSSFEYTQDDLPLYWKPCDQASILPTFGTLENFWNVWRLDHDTANVLAGTNSLRLENNADTVRNGAQAHQVGVMVGSPVTYSISIKSDTDDLPVQLTVWEMYGKMHRQDVKVGREWQRYQMVVKAPVKNAVRGGVEFKAKGTIWLDDAQVELGETVSTYEASVLDTRFVAAGSEPIAFPERIELKRFAKVPVIDGRLGDKWQGMPLTDRFFIKGKTVPESKTEAFLGCDDDNLYLAFRCHCEDVGKLKTAAEQDNNGRIWGDDIVEIFIDPTLRRSSYLHLALNSKGVKAAVGFGKNITRTDTWEGRASVDPDRKCWEAEVKLPLSMLGLSQSTGDEWGINLCRNETSRGEQSCTALTPRVNFHDVAYYGSIIWPGSVVSRFAFDTPEVRLAEALEGDTLLVSGSLQAKAWAGKTLAIQFFSADQPVTDKADVALAGDGTATIDLSCRGAGAKKDVSLVGRIVSPEGAVLKQFETVLKLEKRLDVYTQRNFYMNEENAVLVAKLNISLRDGMSGTASILDPEGKGLWSGTVDTLKPSMRVDLPIASLPAGTYETRFDIGAAGKASVSASAPLIKRPYQANATQIDRERRCVVVDGKPFLVIAPLEQGGYAMPVDLALQERIVKNYSDAGFKTLMLVTGIRPNFEDTMNGYFDSTQKHGLKLIAWPGGFSDKKMFEYGIEKMTAQWGGKPSLIAWLPVDEPELYAKPEDVITCIEEFRKCDRYHPIFMNNTVMGIPSRFANLTTDILSIDDYVTNRENRKVAEIIEQVSVIAKAGAADRKPAWMFLVGNNLHNHPREPSVGEQVAQSYGSIIVGATGVYYFLGMPSGKRHWEVCKQINRELLSLSDVIFSLDEVSPATAGSSSVLAMTRRFEGSLYVITVNVEKDPVEVPIVIPESVAAGAKVEVLFEDRSIELNGDRFSDAYAPHQRHVYRIDLAKP